VPENLDAPRPTGSRPGQDRSYGQDPAPSAAGGRSQYVPETASATRPDRPTERGLPGWAAVGVLLVVAGIGGLIDQVSGASVQGAFNYGMVVASLIAILIVRRSQMFAVVIAPPLVYFIASAVKLYLSSGGLKNRDALINAAANWLVYGFPAIAGATAVVLVIAGFRILSRR
jgi:hypothetical protein